MVILLPTMIYLLAKVVLTLTLTIDTSDIKYKFISVFFGDTTAFIDTSIRCGVYLMNKSSEIGEGIKRRKKTLTDRQGLNVSLIY
ncbi:hypothetical protein BCU68_13455 [Vibrio sp. 10N.286.49.B3]|nr:hypothetical protein BCU68_13455 [Vibrio sp. 10N.286.49.B3]